jgi:hypothetical protein
MKPDNQFKFGMWDSIDAFSAEGQEGLYYDLQGNRTNTQTYNAGAREYDLNNLSGNAGWYEVDTSLPLAEQVDLRTMTRYVNQPAIDEFRRIAENITQKIDLGGVLEKDRLRASEDPSGIFSFGLASPSLYRVVEWYIIELDLLVDGSFVECEIIDKVRNLKKFYTYVDKKQYNVRRQQKGTFEMLKNNPNAQLIEVSADMYATKPSTYVSPTGQNFRLKFATKAKKIYLVRPKKGGAPKYIDLFVIAGGLGDLNSEGMMAKITPVLMLANQLEQAGVKTRIYGLRAYTVGNDDVFFSWVAKEYGAPVDVQQIAIVTGDPRFFRWSMWQNTEGILKKRFQNSGTGFGSTIYGGNPLSEGFLKYKNYLMQEKQKGLLKTKVSDKALFITGGLPNPTNAMASNQQAIEEEFYRISDIAELALAEKPDKAIRRIVQRERGRGVDDLTIKNRLIRSMNEAFLTIDQRSTLSFNPPDDAKKMLEREERIITQINQILP